MGKVRFSQMLILVFMVRAGNKERFFSLLIVTDTLFIPKGDVTDNLLSSTTAYPPFPLDKRYTFSWYGKRNRNLSKPDDVISRDSDRLSTSCQNHNYCPDNSICKPKSCSGFVCQCKQGFVKSRDGKRCLRGRNFKHFKRQPCHVHVEYSINNSG